MILFRNSIIKISKNGIFLSQKYVKMFSTQQQEKEQQQNTNDKQQQSETKEQTDFGYTKVNLNEKQKYVDEVFHSVASKYDLMNDLMSLGIHRYWKNTFVSDLGYLRPQTIYVNDKPTQRQVRVLDVAGGTGDIAFKILELDKGNKQFVTQPGTKVTVFDINQSMLDVGKKRAQELGFKDDQVEFICGNAEELPFSDNTFDAYTIAFGIRNVPRIPKAIKEAHRVLVKGGVLKILEFSKVTQYPLNEIYKFYNFNIVPQIGQIITNDKRSYQYLAESIDKFHSQESLLKIIQEQGFKYSSFQNLNLGIVAIHTGFKL